MRNINLLLYYKSRFHKIFNFVIKTLNDGALRQVMLVNIRFYLKRSNQDLDRIPKPMQHVIECLSTMLHCIGFYHHDFSIKSYHNHKFVIAATIGIALMIVMIIPKFACNAVWHIAMSNPSYLFPGLV